MSENKKKIAQEQIKGNLSKEDAKKKVAQKNIEEKINTIIKSISSIDFTIDFDIYWSSSVFTLCIPGVSMKTICESASLYMPFKFFLVVCGFFDVIARLSFKIALRSVDFPAFG